MLTNGAVCGVLSVCNWGSRSGQSVGRYLCNWRSRSGHVCIWELSDPLEKSVEASLCLHVCQEDIVNVLRTIKAEDNTAGVTHWHVLLLHKSWYHVTLQVEPTRGERKRRGSSCLFMLSLWSSDCSGAQAHVFWLAQRGVCLLSLSLHLPSISPSLSYSFPPLSLARSFLPPLFLSLSFGKSSLYYRGKIGFVVKRSFPCGSKISLSPHWGKNDWQGPQKPTERV